LNLYFKSNPGAKVLTAELAKTLGVNSHGLVLILGKLNRNGFLEKDADGRFHRSNKVTPISKAG
jgi:DNA-binding IclR family transcriptional regulator